MRTASFFRRPIPLPAIVLLALAIHGPLLIMQLPASTSYDANFHMFFASHYAQHWFDPWNEKWFAGFSQTTYPPLVHQWIALFSRVVGLTEAFMIVQLIAVLLIPVATFRFAKLWVDERSASYAAVFSVFAGSLAFLVYSAGQFCLALFVDQRIGFYVGLFQSRSAPAGSSRASPASSAINSIKPTSIARRSCSMRSTGSSTSARSSPRC